jgi:ketol-acid reductoisomerase
MGFSVETDPAAAAREAEILCLLIPDAEQPAFYEAHLAPCLPKGAALLFAHGFAVHYGQIRPRPDLDALLAAPLAHGDTLRREVAEGGQVPCVMAVAQDASGRAWDRVQAYASAICGGSHLIRSTFAEEVETDLFAEQAVLCGGVPELIRAAFETLTQAGYNEQIAYVSCLRELRAIVDLLLAHSIAGMRERVSVTARYGAATRGPRVIGSEVRHRLDELLAEIRSGAFARELSEEGRQGFPLLQKIMERDAAHQIERAHAHHAVPPAQRREP